jgi:hypothetical protein
MNRKIINYNLNWFLGLSAALFLALGPALVPVMPVSSKRLIEICTAYGVLKMAVEDDSTGQENPPQKHVKPGHCAFCNIRKLALLPPEAPSLSVPHHFTVSAPAPFAILLTARSIPLSYRSRAPPSLLA